MPKSEAAKELARKQKEQAAAEKLRRKNSDNPRDWGTVKQMTETFKRTREVDPTLPWWLLGAFVAAFAVVFGLGMLFQPWWLSLIFGILFGIVAAMAIFVWRVKKGTFKRYEGQAGSAEVALSMLNTKKWSNTPALNGTKQMDVIHRTLGPGGLILVAEGDQRRLQSLLSTEVRRHEQASNGVKVITIAMGDKEGQVPLSKLTDHIKKLPKQLSDTEITDLKQRLKALDAMRSRMPIPKGPMPTRMSRANLRGR